MSNQVAVFEVFRALFVLHQAVAFDWAIEHAFAEGQLIGRVLDRFRQHDAPPPAAEAFYEGIHEAIADDEPDVALAFTLELDRRLFRAVAVDPTGAWEGPGERVAIVRRLASEHPGDLWVVRAVEGEPAWRVAARYDADVGRLAFSPRAEALDGPWALLPGAGDVPTMWVKASRVREAERRGWRLGDAWVDPAAVRARGTLARRSADPRASGLDVTG